jgi:hypothetical protein
MCAFIYVHLHICAPLFTGFSSRTIWPSHIFSPCIVATTFLVCLLALNSRYQIPCHVPVFNFPFVIGIVTLAPTNAVLICAWKEDC